MSTNTVYVLGAGFSKAADLPTSTEFFSEEMFDYMKNKFSKYPDAWNKIKKIQDYVDFRLEKYFQNNIEEILNHIATAKYLFMESVSDSKGAYSAENIFKNILWYITCLIEEKTKDYLDSMPEEYSIFLNHLYKTQSPIITFNYDLIVEIVLQSMNKNFQYGLEENTIDNNDQLILKLHGSLNWGNCDKCGPVILGSHITYDSKSDTCPLCNSKKVSVILIPPVIYKDSYYNDQFFGSLVRESWSLAQEILTNADEIIFIGFSMSEDAYAKELFKLAFSMNTKDLSCLVINRTCNKKLQERYNSILVNNKPKFRSITFTEYVNSRFKQ